MEVLLIIPLKEISEVDAIGYLQHSIVTHGFSFASFSMFCRQLKIKNTKQMKVFNAAQSRNSLVNCQSAMTAPFVNISDLEIIPKLKIFFLRFGKH